MTHQADAGREQHGSLEEIDLGEMEAVTGGCQSCGCSSGGGPKPQSAMAQTRGKPSTQGR